MRHFKTLYLAFTLALAAFAAPRIIAHRGGAGDRPENTLVAIQESLRNGADMIWLSVQVTRDGVPVLFRPMDLAGCTEGHGPVAAHTLAQLKGLNAGWRFRDPQAAGPVSYPYRHHPVPIPTLEEALAAIPAEVPILLDLKSVPAEPLVAAVAKVVQRNGAWHRVRFYSTEARHLEVLRKAHPQALTFEDRDQTRLRLVQARLGGGCSGPPPAGAWVGFELRRPLRVTERFTLGEGRSEVQALLWDRAAVACQRAQPGVQVILFGIDSADDFSMAEALGVDAIMTDSPKAIRALLAKR